MRNLTIQFHNCSFYSSPELTAGPENANGSAKTSPKVASSPAKPARRPNKFKDKYLPEVRKAMVMGLSAKETAAMLGIGISTVNRYRKELRDAIA